MRPATLALITKAGMPTIEPLVNETARCSVLTNGILPSHEKTSDDVGHVMLATQRRPADTSAFMEPRALVSHVDHDSHAVQVPFVDSVLAELHLAIDFHARILWDIQKDRVAIGNRIGALQRDGVDPVWVSQLQQSLDLLHKTETSVNRHLERLGKQHFMAPWVTMAPGLGLPGFCRIMAVTGSLDTFPTVSKVWKYMGMHVTSGHAPRREKGVKFVKTQDGIEGTAYSPQGRVVCHQIGEAIVKVNRGPYRDAYDRKKVEYLARERSGDSECPFGQVHKDRGGTVSKCGDGHAHSAAMRYAVKCLLRDLWIEWKRQRPIST